MRVIVPHTYRPSSVLACCEAAGVEPELHDVSGSPLGYWRLICEIWANQEDCLLIEHDMSFPPETIAGLIDCPELWCLATHEFQLTRWRGEFMRKTAGAFLSCEPLLEDLGDLDLTGIHQVIVGGESGGNARGFDVAWAARLRDQCREQRVAFFMKQYGSRPFERGVGLLDNEGDGAVDVCPIRLNDRKHGADMSEFALDLQVREFPQVRA